MTDAGLLEQVLYHIHNWFVRDVIPLSNCTITNNALPASVLSQIRGQWYRISGSYANDGLHSVDDILTDETFSGTISVLAIPKSLLLVVDEIEEWIALTRDASNAALASPYSSESFGGYSYTLRSDLTGQGGSGGLTGWQAAFASRLNPWRKMH